MDPISELLVHQDGVIARRQALEAGMTPTMISRLLRRREWVVVQRGVYVTHNGPLVWRQRAWAAVLACWPAALDGHSAIRAHEGPGRRGFDPDLIDVMVDYDRHLEVPRGVRLRRAPRFDEIVQWNLAPPRLWYDDAVLLLADRVPREVDAIGVLADACGGRRTTAARLRTRLDGLPWLHRRAWLTRVLDDVGAGTCSVLEHGYLTLVERPHGLPRGVRQASALVDGRRMFRDVLYRGDGWTQIVELDGRLHHDSTTARDRDLERDLDAALAGDHSVRLGYLQVFDRHCRTALKIGRLLRRRGWDGTPTACPACEQKYGGLLQAG